MEIATGWLVLDERGSNVKLKNITPAEVVHLNNTFKRHKDDKEQKVIDIRLVGKANRTNRREKERLEAKYPKTDAKTGEVELQKTWPGAEPSFPETFADAGIELGIGTQRVGKSLPYPSKNDEMLFNAQLDEDIQYEKELGGQKPADLVEA